MKTYLTLSSTQRMHTFREAFAASAEALIRAAEIFAAMEQSGDDIASIPSNLRTALRAIAARTMLPEVWTTLDGMSRRRVARLPVDMQKALVIDRQLVPLVRESGKIEAITVAEMTPKEVLSCISESRILSVAEQQITAPLKKLTVIITTRHRKSRHGVPVCIINGELTHSWTAMGQILDACHVSRNEFAYACGITYAGIVAKRNGLTAQQLNVLRDLAEDHGFAK